MDEMQAGEEYEAAKDEHRPDWPGYHLPECDVNHMTDEDDGWRCICDRLRACEQRVRGTRSFPDSKELSDAYGDGSRDGYSEGYAAALDAARDAVDNVPLPNVLPPTVWQAWIAGNAASIAAIDALRGES